MELTKKNEHETGQGDTEFFGAVSDGERLWFVSSDFSEVFEINSATGELTPYTDEAKWLGGNAPQLKE